MAEVKLVDGNPLAAIPEELLDAAMALSRTMRFQDRVECQRLGFKTPAHAVFQQIVESTWCEMVSIDGEVVAGFGYVDQSIACDIRLPWLFTADSVEKHKLYFVRRVRRVTDDWLNHCGSLVVYVDAYYSQALRMLRAVGFHVGSAEPWAETGELFRKCVKVKRWAQ